MLQVVSEADGSGWVQTLNILLAATVTVSLVLAYAGSWKLRLQVVSIPRDAQVGQPLSFQLRCNRPARVQVGIDGPVSVGQGGSRGWRPIVVAWTPSQRGIVHQIPVTISSSGPLPIWEMRCKGFIHPSNPIAVAPARGNVLIPSRVTHNQGRLQHEDYQIREYVPGDPPKLVSWSLTAHAATLMVREPGAGSRVRILQAELGRQDPEDMAQKLMHTGATAIEQGYQLRVLMPTGATAPVGSCLELGRLLAALPGSAGQARPQ